MAFNLYGTPNATFFTVIKESLPFQEILIFLVVSKNFL